MGFAKKDERETSKDAIRQRGGVQNAQIQKKTNGGLGEKKEPKDKGKEKPTVVGKNIGRDRMASPTRPDTDRRKRDTTISELKSTEWH